MRALLKFTIPAERTCKPVIGLAVDLILRDAATNTIVSVSCRGEKLPLRIVPHAFCREVIVRMPCHLTQGATVDLDVHVSNPVGFERMTLMDPISGKAS